jgi:hypothetical protein
MRYSPEHIFTVTVCVCLAGGQTHTHTYCVFSGLFVLCLNFAISSMSRSSVLGPNTSIRACITVPIPVGWEGWNNWQWKKKKTPPLFIWKGAMTEHFLFHNQGCFQIALFVPDYSCYCLGGFINRWLSMKKGKKIMALGKMSPSIFPYTSGMEEV